MRCIRSERGFTLIEVVVALVLLAVGLLGLQGLALAAVRTTAVAERNTRAAAIATEYLESAVQLVRHGQTPPQLCVMLADGGRVSRAVDLADPRAPKVTVVVTLAGTPPRPYSLSSYVFSPTPLPAPAGNACS